MKYSFKVMVKCNLEYCGNFFLCIFLCIPDTEDHFEAKNKINYCQSKLRGHPYFTYNIFGKFLPHPSPLEHFHTLTLMSCCNTNANLLPSQFVLPNLWTGFTTWCSYRWLFTKVSYNLKYITAQTIWVWYGNNDFVRSLDPLVVIWIMSTRFSRLFPTRVVYCNSDVLRLSSVSLRNVEK
jgi:hypothetical protein